LNPAQQLATEPDMLDSSCRRAGAKGGTIELFAVPQAVPQVVRLAPGAESDGTPETPIATVRLAGGHAGRKHHECRHQRDNASNGAHGDSSVVYVPDGLRTGPPSLRQTSDLRGVDTDVIAFQALTEMDRFDPPRPTVLLCRHS
jgi:hypothetical protein